VGVSISGGTTKEDAVALALAAADEDTCALHSGAAATLTCCGLWTCGSLIVAVPALVEGMVGGVKVYGVAVLNGLDSVLALLNGGGDDDDDDDDEEGGGVDE